jgi:hypothetical protein
VFWDVCIDLDGGCNTACHHLGHLGSVRDAFEGLED